jgi:diaminopimelate epimerase
VKIPFVKMSGAGNDMILIDHRARFLAGREIEFVRAACERRSGIGADAVLLVEPEDGFDFRVRFFNPDGGEYGLCGNGARCIPRFAREIGIPGPRYRFVSSSGEHEAWETADDRARVTLSVVRETRLKIPVDVDGAAATMDWGDIGVPHAVMWVEDVNRVPIETWGAHLRRHRAFGPEGSNVSFAQVLAPGKLAIRTFERGVEGETLACGSGSAVAATLARERGFAGDQVDLKVRSGETLSIELPPRGTAKAPILEGPIQRCFEGVFEFPRSPKTG